MDKGLKRILKGRASIAVAMAVCLALIALPSLAFAATSLVGSPSGTVALAPSTVGVAITSSDTFLNTSDAAITIDGISFPPQVTPLGAVTGTWTYAETLVNGFYVPSWTWTPIATPVASVGAMYTFASPAAQANGPHNVTATINGATTSWTYTVAIPASTQFISVLPAAGTNSSNVSPTLVLNVSADVTSVDLTINGGTPVTGLVPVAGVVTYPVPTAFASPSTVSVSATAHGTGTATTAWSFTIGGPTALHVVTNPNVSACVTCHPGTLPAVHGGCICHTILPQSELDAAAAAGNSCVACHVGKYAAHGFGFNDNAPYPGPNNIPVASGHNTTTYGKIGGLSMFDSSQGVTLKTTDNVTPADSITTTVTSTWATPTANVFWGANDPKAPATAKTGLNWNSVITCQDCHTGLNVAGPHGAAQNWGIDPNYPAPYDMAVNSHATESGIAVRTGTPAWSSSQVVPMAGTAAAPDLSGFGNGANTPALLASRLAAQGLADATTPGTNGVICAKCHKLFDFDNAYTAGNYVGGSHGYGFNNTTGIGNDSNTAHASHHWDLNNGAADCVSCHIGMPHGWTRPRLLVNSFDGTYTVTVNSVSVTATSHKDAAPYLDPASRLMTATPNAFNQHPTTRGMGPLSSTDQHTLVAGTRATNPGAGAQWTEANCVACGATPSASNGAGLEHTGIVTDPNKLK